MKFFPKRKITNRQAVFSVEFYEEIFADEQGEEFAKISKKRENIFVK